MNQHDYVRECLKFYEDNGIVQGNPEEGVWNHAHYPSPEGEGEGTVLLLWEHHQVQGVLQSEEYGKCCFWDGDVKSFLTLGTFISGWFDLYGLYEKWSHDRAVKAGKATHSERDTSGRSLNGLRAAERLNSEKDELGRSVQAVKSSKKLLAEKNDLGQSVNSVKGGINSHSNRTPEGKSVRAIEHNSKIHSEKDENGRSKVAMKTNSQLWKCTITGHISTPGPLTRYQNKRGINTKNRIKIS
jgi:hypothetical protein